MEENMNKKALVLLAPGFEEVEAITSIDYLRRAVIEVTIAAVGSKSRTKKTIVTGSHGISVEACAALENLAAEKKLRASAWDAVVVPGGIPGADNIAASKEAGDFIRAMAKAEKPVCAICAAPARVLFPLGVLAGKKFTCYPGEESVLKPGSDGVINTGGKSAVWVKDRVVVDGNFITSRSAGTAGEFACAIISKLVSEEEAKKLAQKVLLK